MEILTREITGFVEEGNLTADSGEILALDLARGNAAVINEIVQFVTPRLLVAITSNIALEGRIALVLDSNLIAVGDIPAAGVTQADTDVGEGRGILEMFSFGYFLSGQQDTTNNNASAAVLGGARGQSVNYRGLRLEDRPMTTENPEQISQVTPTGGGIGVNAVTQVKYQIVRLSTRELGELSGDVRPTVLRVPSVPQGGGQIMRTVF